MSLLNMSRI